jgi:hypothetical protein
MMALPLQWIAVAALGCVGVDDVSGDDARLLGPEAAYRTRSSGGQHCRLSKRFGRC